MILWYYDIEQIYPTHHDLLSIKISNQYESKWLRYSTIS